jgi:hypothetical protein
MDTDGDGTDDALFFGEHLVYETSIAMMAIGASQAPDKTVPNIGSQVDGWKFKDVEQYALNYLIYTQQPNGGWGYHHGEFWSDNSNTGYAVLGLMYAQNKFGLAIPENVTNSLNNWIDYIQCDENGGSNDANWDPGWMGWAGQWPEFQTTYTMMKGFESMGIPEINVSGTKVDWYDVVSTAIVSCQNEDGSWNYTVWGDELLSTEWALLTLERTVEKPVVDVDVDIKPGSCPNPLNLFAP